MGGTAEGWQPPGNRADPGALTDLQRLADAGHIKLLTAWCSELGYFSTADGGHFHGQGSVHLPATFEVLPRPGEGVTPEMPPPLTFSIPLDKTQSGRS